MANVVVSVTDQGSGIAPEDLPHLFEKRYRARTVGHIPGNGLGLYGSRLSVETLTYGGVRGRRSRPRTYLFLCDTRPCRVPHKKR